MVYPQSLAQLRDATPLGPAHPAGVTPAAFEGWADTDGRCSLPRLIEIVSKRLPAECIAPEAAGRLK